MGQGQLLKARYSAEELARVRAGEYAGTDPVLMRVALEAHEQEHIRVATEAAAAVEEGMRAASSLGRFGPSAGADGPLYNSDDEQAFLESMGF